MKMSRDAEKNLQKAVSLIGEAARQGAEIVCLPELFSTPYFPQSRGSEYRPVRVPGELTDALSEAARTNSVVLVGGSVYERSGRGRFNTCFVFDEEGRMLGRYRKVHLPQDPGFYEQDYFTAGHEYKVFETRRGRLGVLICFDQWYPEPARITKLMGADMIFYPTAIGTIQGVRQTEGDWRAAWEAVQRGHAIANSVVVAAVNRAGTEGDLSFWGGSFVYDQFGTLLARAGEAEEIVLASCDLTLSREAEDGWGFMRNRMPRTYSRLAERR
jgi:agmatine deiminase